MRTPSGIDSKHAHVHGRLYVSRNARKVSRVSNRISPYDAWQRLLEGNERFVAGDSKHPNQNASRRSELVNSQNPFAVIFGCADSRLAAEIIFDVGLGDVFEHAKQTVRRLLDSSRTIYDAVDNYSAAVVGVAYRLEEGRAQLVSTSGVL